VANYEISKMADDIRLYKCVIMFVPRNSNLERSGSSGSSLRMCIGVCMVTTFIVHDSFYHVIGKHLYKPPVIWPQIDACNPNILTATGVVRDIPMVSFVLHVKSDQPKYLAKYK
jgi:hypothetical protein